MIFIILKDWKSKKGTRYTVEPNRFELSPKESQLVKFYLNSEVLLNADEAFTIEGCSVNFPKREVIWESTLRAKVITSTLSFSEKDLIFNCCYGDDKKNQSSKVLK